MRKLKCLRCGEDMQFMSREDFQLGRTGFPNLKRQIVNLRFYSTLPINR